MALTSNDELNALAAQRFAPLFGRENTYQLPPPQEGDREGGLPAHLSGRLLFAPDATFSSLASRFATGSTVKSTKITDQFTMDDFRTRYGEDATLLFLVADDKLGVSASDRPPDVRPGQRIVALVAAAPGGP